MSIQSPFGSSLITSRLEAGSFRAMEKEDFEESFMDDVVKVGSYLPFVSIITGIARLAFIHIAAKEAKEENGSLSGEDKKLVQIHKARAFAEIACVFGPVLLVGDIAFSIWEIYKHMRESKKHSTA